MKFTTVCGKCESSDIEYKGHDKCFCYRCNMITEARDKIVESPYERTRRQVYSTGNKWAIENFNATH